jgi:fatty-acyl-CoA synthase
MPASTTPAPSYDHGTSTLRLRPQTMGSIFDQTVARIPDHEALVVRDQQVRWTWRNRAERVDAFADGLTALGLQPGERVGIWAPSFAEYMIAQFALAKAGLICVTLNPAYRTNELHYALNKTGCRALITARALRGADFIELLTTLMPELPASAPGELQAAAVPSLAWVIQIGPDPAAGCIAFDNNAAQLADAMRMSEGERLCVPVPMFRCFGYVASTLLCTISGATIVFPSAAF